jgi:aspartate/methionine/tyrosine aminotransferase
VSPNNPTGAVYPAAALTGVRSLSPAHLERLDAARRRIFETLGGDDVPCDIPPADGAFYYLIRAHSALDSMTLTERLIREHRVAVIPGSAFADASPCSIRISYGALDADSIAEGVGRLVTGLRALA